uniref:Exportin-1 n=1 Tax=Cajanus cajan TaxID=3821 RepID=A0A151RLT8_CAJCA|nr:Exportin-1 [Cajanus cajan]
MSPCVCLCLCALGAHFCVLYVAALKFGNTTNIPQAYSYGSSEEQGIMLNFALFFTSFCKAVYIHEMSWDQVATLKFGNTTNILEAYSYGSSEEQGIMLNFPLFFNSFCKAGSLLNSGIQYVVGQYPQFLRAHWTFLKAIVNNFLELLHVTHRGVQHSLCPRACLCLCALRAHFCVLYVCTLWWVAALKFGNTTNILEAYSNGSSEEQVAAFRFGNTTNILEAYSYSSSEEQMVPRILRYVVGQYPRFLRARWKFLKAVVNKFLEFLHEPHPVVQNFALFFTSICKADDTEDFKEYIFFVMVIWDPLYLCEITTGKDNKVVIVRNIMLVVGQYPRFLRARWKFLKAVVNKFLEFLHETHPGVQVAALQLGNTTNILEAYSYGSSEEQVSLSIMAKLNPDILLSYL